MAPKITSDTPSIPTVARDVEPHSSAATVTAVAGGDRLEHQGNVERVDLIGSVGPEPIIVAGLDEQISHDSETPFAAPFRLFSENATVARETFLQRLICDDPDNIGLCNMSTTDPDADFRYRELAIVLRYKCGNFITGDPTDRISREEYDSFCGIHNRDGTRFHDPDDDIDPDSGTAVG